MLNAQKYTNKNLQLAIAHVKEHGNINQAAERYGIPRSTLGDKVHGKSVPQLQRRGPKPPLGVNEERLIADKLIELSNVGHGLPRREVCLSVKKILDDAKRKVPAFTNNLPSKNWFYAFLKRHPDLSVRRTQKLEIARAMACSPESIEAWFMAFESLLREQGITSPSQIYNADESGFPLQDSRGAKVVTAKMNRRPFHITSSSKEASPA